jgi:hypothetical protein
MSTKMYCVWYGRKTNFILTNIWFRPNCFRPKLYRVKFVSTKITVFDLKVTIRNTNVTTTNNNNNNNTTIVTTAASDNNNNNTRFLWKNAFMTCCHKHTTLFRFRHVWERSFEDYGQFFIQIPPTEEEEIASSSCSMWNVFLPKVLQKMKFVYIHKHTKNISLSLPLSLSFFLAPTHVGIYDRTIAVTHSSKWLSWITTCSVKKHVSILVFLFLL